MLTPTIAAIFIGKTMKQILKFFQKPEPPIPGTIAMDEDKPEENPLQEKLEQAKEENLKLMRDYIASRSVPPPKPEVEHTVIVYAFFSDMKPNRENLLGSVALRDGEVCYEDESGSWHGWESLDDAEGMRRIIDELNSDLGRWAVTNDNQRVNFRRWKREKVSAAKAAAEIMGASNWDGEYSIEGFVTMDDGRVFRRKEIQLAIPASKVKWWMEQ